MCSASVMGRFVLTLMEGEVRAPERTPAPGVRHTPSLPLELLQPHTARPLSLLSAGAGALEAHT